MAEPLIDNSVYPKKSVTERKIVEKGKLETTNFSVSRQRRRGAENRGKKRKEDLGTRVGERPVRRACSVHEGSISGAGNREIKRKEDQGTRVGERPVRRACSMHEGTC